MMLMALVLSATLMAQEDITDQYLQNADLSTLGGGWSYGDNGYNYTAWDTSGDVPVVEFYHTWGVNPGYSIGSLRNFHFTQTITLPAGDYRIAVSAFYREGNGNGTNTKAYIFAGDKQQYVYGLTAAEQLDVNGSTGKYVGSSDLLRAANAFSKGDFSNAFDFSLTTEQEITLGFRGYIDTYCSWCILGPVKLYKYSLEDYLVEYRAKVAEANALSGKMGAAEAQALNDALVPESSFSLCSEVTEAIATLTNAINAARVSIENYATLTDALVNASVILQNVAGVVDNDAITTYYNAVSDVQRAYDDGTVTDFAGSVATVETALIPLVKYQTADNSDYTMAIVNPHVNGSEGWICDRPYGGNGPMLGGNKFEYWAGNAWGREDGSFDYYQEITGLPDGYYRVSASMFNSLNDEGGSYTVFSPTSGVYAASGSQEVVALVDEEGMALKPYTTDEILVTNGTIRIGVKNVVTPMAARWFVADDFHLTLVRTVKEEDMEPYAVLSDDNTVLTFYYDGNKAERNGMDVETPGPAEINELLFPSWYQYHEAITTVVFDDSFANCTWLTSTAYWFYQCSNLTTIIGIENLKTVMMTMSAMFYGCSNLTNLDMSGFKFDCVEDISWMFAECPRLTSIDISGFTTENVTNMDGMFKNCSSLRTVYAGDGWSTVRLDNKDDTSIGEGFPPVDWFASGVDMFTGCTSLVGGKGTVYDENHTDYTYARIDGGEAAPGYFTAKETTAEPSELNYAFDDESLTASVIALEGDQKYEGDIVIPETVQHDGRTYQVTSIGDNAFYYSDITSIVIPNSVTSIGTCSFRFCSSLKNLNIPNSVTQIGYNTFEGCGLLSSVFIPASVKEIGYAIFADCMNLEEIKVDINNTVYDSRDNCNAIVRTSDNAFYVGCNNSTIPNSITSISEYAFYNCIELSTIKIPNNVTSIGYCAFHNCRNLTTIIIPTSVTNLSYGIFPYCTNLETIIVEEDNPAYDSRNNCNAIIRKADNTLIAGCKNTIIPITVKSIETNAFVGYVGDNFVIPNNVISIGDWVFQGSLLKSLTLPKDLKYIGEQAFAQCYYLTDLFIYCEDLPTIGGELFNAMNLKPITLHVPVTAFDIYRSTEPWSQFGTIVPIEEENPNITIPTDGLVAYYPFNGNANDESGHGNNGTVIGHVELAADRFGNANSAYRFFNEPMNYISVPDDESLHLSTFTLNAWVYSDAEDYGSNFLICKGRDIENGSYQLYVSGISATNEYSGINGAWVENYPQTGTWHMISGTVDGDQAKFYIDGVLMSEATLTHPFVYSDDITDPLTLGMHYFEGVPEDWAYPLRGVLDDVRIYNRALTVSDIRSLYAEGSTNFGEKQIFTVNGVSFNMVKVNGGTFMMGSEDGYEDEKPVHQVTLTNDYYIGETEVTQELWEAVMGSVSCNFNDSPLLPVEASWTESQTFIERLNELTGLTFRLPTEAEWEFAARGGNASQGYLYSGSNNLDEVGWYNENSDSKTHVVASKAPNELGIYDMSGNVWEWCQDWFDSFSSEPQVDPTGPASASYRVKHGGAWSSDGNICRVSVRHALWEGNRGIDNGLRLAISSSEVVPTNETIPTEAIDLGLPSGTKWAPWNVGASKPEDYGGYYAWGETEEKDTYYWSTYIHCDGSPSSCHDIGMDIAGTEYDVAHVKWGGSWTMPTFEQLKELWDNCSLEWTTLNGINGCKFTGPNGNSIFLPASGMRGHADLEALGLHGCYWSSSVDEDCTYNGHCLGTYSGGAYDYEEGFRDYGRSVRPVISVAPIATDIAIDATNFPDENFRNYLLSQDYGQDGVLTQEEIAGVWEIDVPEKNIQSLQGIAFFSALEMLVCNLNPLKSLDVSKNTALTWLNCSSNQLTSVDVSKNTALTFLDCGCNQLTSLDVSNNTALTTLYCNYNQLTSLDVSHNTALTGLDCGFNQLTSLDVSKNMALEWLACYNNLLTSVDVSKNMALTTLYCYYNQLTSLDVSHNTALSALYCNHNYINEAAMDALVTSLPKTENGEFYVKVPAELGEGNVITSAQVAAANAKGWKVYQYNETWDRVEMEGDMSIPDEAIDLGLPSGTKWAPWNVGASKPEDFGGYYAWGETEEKEVYDWSTYIHCDGWWDSCHDIGVNIDGTQYDVAQFKWGGAWTMPTKDQVQELLDKCTTEWVTMNGVNGCRFTGPNGNSIFLPAGGWDNEPDMVSSNGIYWSSTVDERTTSFAIGISFGSDDLFWGYSDRCHGCTVRPVIASSGNSNAEPYAVLSDDNTTLTFYYDTQKEARGGMSVGPFASSRSRSWYNQASSITTVVFDDSFANWTTLTSTAYWFENFSNLTTITGIENLKTDNVTNMRAMFSLCSSLTNLDVSGFKTDNVTDMRAMFQGCENLSSLDVSGFKTDNVTNMSYLFWYCPSLKILDLSGFKTDNVTDMSSMFYNCYGLKSLDVSNFKTDNVTDMSGMFMSSGGLTSLDLSGFKTDNVSDMSYMFCQCYDLTNLDVSGFKTENVTNMASMFQRCSGLESLDLSGFNTANVTNMSEMFSGCSALKTIYGSNWDTSSVTSSSLMFSGCKNLVGGKGTVYDDNHIDHTYARIDGGEAAPGYFTAKETDTDTDISQLDNVIYIEQTEALVGSETTLSIKMKNTVAIRGFQFDLYLPDGVTLAKNNKGRVITSLNEGRLPEDDEHTLSVSQLEDGSYRFLCGSLYEETFTGSDGEVATVKLNIAADMENGNYPLVLRNIKMTENDITNTYMTDEVRSTLTLIDYVTGDINGDGAVDVSDYIGIANHIMGNTPAGFNEKAADVDGDGLIDVSDYIGVGNIITTGSIYGSHHQSRISRHGYIE